MGKKFLQQAIGIETQGGVFSEILPRGEPLPAKKSMIFSTADDNQHTVTIRLHQGDNGKAVQNRLIGSFDVSGVPAAPRGVPQIEVIIAVDASGNLSVEAKDKASNASRAVKYDEKQAAVAVTDIAPPPDQFLAAPVGIETLGGVFSPLLVGGAKLPATAVEVFSTAEDNQSAVTIRLHQGNGSKASENRLISSFNLDGILPAKASVPQIEVMLTVEKGGNLTVSAKDLGTGKAQRVVMDQANTRAEVTDTAPQPEKSRPERSNDVFEDLFDGLFNRSGSKNSQPQPQPVAPSESAPAPQPPRAAASANPFVFISHAASDSVAALDLVGKLEVGGRSCWIAPRNIPAGADYRAEIVTAIKEASHLVALISKSANASSHVLREIALAEQYGKKIIPIRVDDSELRSELEYLLQGLHWVRIEAAAEALNRSL